MYNNYDVQYELASHENSVAVHGDRICNNVKKGRFQIDTYSINSYQSIKYLLNKGATDSVEIRLIDKLQDLHDKEKVTIPVPPTLDVLVLPTYTAPVLVPSSVTSVTAPAIIPNIYVVGEVINFVVKAGYSDINGASAGSIIEPWNNNIIQNVRQGEFISAQHLVTDVPTYANGLSGGTMYSTLNQLVTTVISDDGLNFSLSLTDVEVGYGKLSFKANSTFSQGPTPLDNLGNSLSTLVNDPLIDGTLVGGSYNTNSGVGAFSIDGRFPIYIKSGVLEEILTDLEFYFNINNNFNPIFNYTTGLDYEIKIATEDVNTRGPVTIYDYYTATDITADAVITTITKTIETGLEVSYNVYTIPTLSVTSGTLGLKFN